MIPNLHLPYITLAIVDNNHPEAAAEAIRRSTLHIDFGAVVHIDEPSIRSVEDYSRYVFKELHHHIHTRHCLIIQHDGYIINPYLWQDRFSAYDYIGAPWWYLDNNVGNGGFSLRSLDLMKELAGDRYTDVHPEDDRIGRKYRATLEREGFTFAPEWLAAQFSFEPNPKYKTFKNNTFGVHNVKNTQL